MDFKSIKKKDSKFFIEELKHFATNSPPNITNQALDIAHYLNNEFLFEQQQNEVHRNYSHVMNSDISVNPNFMRFNEMPFVAEFDVSNNKTVTTDKMSLSTPHSIEQLNRKSFEVTAEDGICEKNKQFTTLNFQCFNIGCPQMFNNKFSLKLHMFNQHGINQYRCLEKNCKQSFTNSNNLGDHIRNDHSSITQWNCDECPNYFAAYDLLYRHNYLHHQLGQYKCSFLNCQVVVDQRQKIQSHYKSQHQFSGRVQSLKSLNFGIDAVVQQQNEYDFDPSIFVETILVENPLSLVFNSETCGISKSGINGESLYVDAARINNDEKMVIEKLEVSHNKPITIDQLSLSLLTPHSNEKMNQNSFEVKQQEEYYKVEDQILIISRQCLYTGCSLMFNTKVALDLHMLTQHNLNEYRCFVKDCKQSFIDENKLSNHIKKDHTSTSKLSCEKCSKKFYSYILLLVHHHSFHQLGKYKCAFPKCEFLNEQRKKVQNHYNQKHKIVESQLKFSGLSLCFNSETLSEINRQSLDVDAARINNDKTMVIEEFEVSYNKPIAIDQMSLSLLTPHSNEKKKQNSFEVKEQEEYYKVEDQILILSRQCFYTGCSLMFNTKLALDQHMLTQHNLNKYRCFVKDCKQSFINKTEMSKHIKNEHTSTSKLSCEKCSNKFSAYDLLRVHHHCFHQLGKYKCTFPKCEFLDEQRKKVQNHYSREHNILELTCQYGNCGRRFNDQSNFKRHKLTHKNNKNSYI